MASTTASAPAAKPIIGQRIIGFDLLRGLAALGVAIPHFLLLYHHNATLESISIIAVEIFFGLSGYVLAPQVIKLHQNASNYNLWVFFLRRWIRTITPYLLALVLIGFLTANIFTLDFLKKMFFVDTFVSVKNTDFFAISWSLAVEEWYYVTAALLVFIFRKARITTLFMGAALVFFLIKLGGMFVDPNWDVAVRRATIYRLDAIAFGFLFFMFKDRVNLKWPAAIVAVFGTLGITILLLTLFKTGLGGFQKIFMLGAIYSLSAFSLAVVYLFGLIDPLIEKLKLFKFSEFLGNISYPVYLFHLPFAYAFSSLKIPMMTGVLLALGSTVLFSWLFHELIERSLIFGRPRYKDDYEARVSSGRPAGQTPWHILQSWGLAVIGLAFVALIIEPISRTYLNKAQRNLVTDLYKTDQDMNKIATKHILGALDPQLGYAHPKKTRLNSKKFGTTQWGGYGVHRAKSKEFYKVYILGGSTSDPLMAVARRHGAWSMDFYNECRRVRECGVWNGGVGGYGSHQELLRLVRDIVPEKPDLVMSLHGPNELNRIRKAPFTTGFSNELIIQESKKGKVWLNNWWPNTLSTLAIIRREDDQPARDREIYYGYDYSKRSAFENWKANVAMMDAIATSQGTTYITVLQPLVGWGEYKPTKGLPGMKRGKKYFQLVNDFYLEATAHCATVDYCIDVSKAFDGKPPGLYRDARHPNHDGNVIIAKAVTAELKSRGVLVAAEVVATSETDAAIPK